MAGIVAGVFNTTTDAERAIKTLIANNFTDDNIGVVVHNRDIGPGIADDLGREYRAGINPPENELTSPSDVYETLPAGFTRALMHDGKPSGDTGWFASQLDAGKVLVIVNAGNRTNDATNIMHNNGMVDNPTMGSDMMASSTMPQGTTTRPMTTPTTTPTMAREEAHVPIIEEEVVVERTPHQVGEVEVTSETSAMSVDIPTTITHEELRVERRKLDHPLRPDEYKAISAEGGVLRMPIVEEEIRVTKTPIIREELVITRMPVNEQQTIHETVMHTEPHVETTGNVDVEDVNQTGMTSEGPDTQQKRPAA